MNYEELSDSRKYTILEILKQNSSIRNSVTRKQLQEACNKGGITFPQWITTPENTIGRGLYKFPNIQQFASQSDIQIQEKSDEEILEKLQDIDESFKDLVLSISNNVVNSLVISGAPGLGKSHDVNKILIEKNGGEFNHVFWRGYIRATGLFKLLYENRHKGQIVVLDDTDSIFQDEVALNILKAALELKSSRTIGWGSEKEFIDQDGDIIPRYFQYEGSIIFLSNLSMRKMIEQDSKNAKHLAAIESRSLVFDIKIETPREFLLKIKLKLDDGLLSSHGLTKDQQMEVYQYLKDNQNKLTELSLRMAEKLGLLFKSNPAKWRKLADHICLR